MPQNWRWKAITIAVSIVVSIYILIPTLVGWSNETDIGAKAAKDRPALAALFPRKGLNLGLDLRGGIYIEFDVEMTEALTARTDILHSELARFLKREDIKVDSLTRVPDSYRIKAVLPDEENSNRFTNFILDNYGVTLTEVRDERVDTTQIWTLTESFKKRTKEMTMRQAVETIRNRIDKYGVTEPTIQRLGTNKIAVELPGVRDPDRTIALIKRGGRLEFKLVDESIPDAEVAKLVAAVRQENEITGYTDEDVERIETALADKIPEGSAIVFKVIFDPIAKKVTGGTPYLLKRKAELTGDMLSDAQVQVQGNEPYVSLTFNDTGAEVFRELTGNNIGKRLAIVLDDRVSSAPVIKSKIPQGRAQITLGYGDYRSLLREAEDLTLVLREGALPATLVERTKTIIGPSLGKISIEKGIKALLLGGVFVVIFMMLYYRLSGVFATVALGTNVLLLFAILTLFQATLTLPGLAGIILTLGMAVDANIIVFERIREEVRDGKKPRAAMEAGYGNAMSAIIDANVTTFLVGVVLYQFGTGPIRGFAVTLMIGIMTTLFTALVMTKAIQTWYVYGRGVSKLSI